MTQHQWAFIWILSLDSDTIRSLCGMCYQAHFTDCGLLPSFPASGHNTGAKEFWMSKFKEVILEESHLQRNGDQ